MILDKRFVELCAEWCEDDLKEAGKAFSAGDVNDARAHEQSAAFWSKLAFAEAAA